VSTGFSSGFAGGVVCGGSVFAGVAGCALGGGFMVVTFGVLAPPAVGFGVVAVAVAMGCALLGSDCVVLPLGAAVGVAGCPAAPATLIGSWGVPCEVPAPPHAAAPRSNTDEVIENRLTRMKGA